MCSYSGLNGIPSCANDYLLNQLVRNAWKRPDVVIATDCGAITNMKDHNHYAINKPDAAAKTMNGGSDIDLGDDYFAPIIKGGNGALIEARAQNVTDITRIDTAVSRVLAARFKVGLFDPLELNSYTQISIDDVNSTYHQTVVLEATQQGLVLLKNERSTLPLRKSAKLALLGPHVISTRDLYESYVGDMVCYSPLGQPHTYDCVETIGAAFTRLHGAALTSVHVGVGLDSSDTTLEEEALSAAQAADEVVLVLGLGNNQEHEGTDRTSIGLPGLQADFALKVLALGKPTTGMCWIVSYVFVR
jgi:beta-D-xylosidase 4